MHKSERVARYMDMTDFRHLLTVVSLAACTVLPAGAEIVTHMQAKRLAQEFFNEASREVTPEVEMVYKGKDLTTQKLFTPFYTFNSPRGGFVIISAENKTMPILAYSLTDRFSEDKLSEAERQLLGAYARDVEMIRYDDRVPYEAMKAWGNFPQYVHDLLARRPEVVYSAVGAPDAAEARERIDNLLTLTRSEDLYSDLYSPDQWAQLADEQFARDGYVLMGLLGPEDVSPVIISGRQGNFYRITLTEGHAPWMALLNATEYLSDGMIADFYSVPILGQAPQEDTAFGFYESIIADFEHDAAERTRSFEERLRPTQPILTHVGGGRFGVTMPSDITLVRLYNVGGAMIGQQTYGGTPTAWIDLGHEPGGFYLAQVFSEGADPVTFKLYR